MKIINIIEELPKVAFNHEHEFETVYGKVISIERFITAISKRDFQKSKLVGELGDISKLRNKHIKNYYGVLAYATATKIKELDLVDEIKQFLLEKGIKKSRDYRVESFDTTATKVVFGTKCKVPTSSSSLKPYLLELKAICDLILTDRFVDEEISKLINSKLEKDSELFDGVTIG